MEKIKLGLEWFINPDHIPFIVGMEKGWFAESGLQIEMIEPEAHFDAIDQIKAGEMDIAITEPLHLVEDKARGHEVVGIGRFLHTNGGVMYNKDKGITRPSDMIGKRIQYPGAPGLGGLSIVKTMVEHDGATCTYDDFEPVNHGFYHTEALQQDKADAATLIFRNFEMIEASHQGLQVDYFALKDWGIPDFCQLIFITSPQVIQRRRGAIQTFLQVVQKAIDFIYENPIEAKEIYERYTKADLADTLHHAICDATIPCFTYDFSMTEAYYDTLQAWLYDTKQISERIDAAQCWTNDLLFKK